jgi:hypothetical protein
MGAGYRKFAGEEEKVIRPKECGSMADAKKLRLTDFASCAG